MKTINSVIPYVFDMIKTVQKLKLPDSKPVSSLQHPFGLDLKGFLTSGNQYSG